MEAPKTIAHDGLPCWVRTARSWKSWPPLWKTRNCWGRKTPAYLVRMDFRQEGLLTDCTSEIRGRSFSNAISINRLTLSTGASQLVVSFARSIRHTGHFVPGAAALSRNMGHEKTWPTADGVRYHGQDIGITKRILATHLTLPIPAMILADGVESLFPNPANGQSSRNGESGSSRIVIRSRAGSSINQLSRQYFIERSDPTYEAAVLYSDAVAKIPHFLQQIPEPALPRTSPTPLSSSLYWPGIVGLIG